MFLDIWLVTLLGSSQKPSPNIQLRCYCNRTIYRGPTFVRNYRISAEVRYYPYLRKPPWYQIPQIIWQRFGAIANPGPSGPTVNLQNFLQQVAALSTIAWNLAARRCTVSIPSAFLYQACSATLSKSFVQQGLHQEALCNMTSVQNFCVLKYLRFPLLVLV